MLRTLFALGWVFLCSVPASAQTLLSPESDSQVSSISANATASSARATQSRALVLEDFYRLKSVGSPRISPDGQWVAYTVSTPVEQTNEDETQSWVVPTDGSAEPARVTQEGQDVTDPEWSNDGRLRVTAADDTQWLVDPQRPADSAVRDDSEEIEGQVSPDGRWLAWTEELPSASSPPPNLTPFEQRHEERFKGHALDWYPFVSDGDPFPLPDRRNQPPVEIFLRSTDGGGESRQLTRLGLRAGNLEWSPGGNALLFSADESVHDELAYGRSDLFMVDVDGVVTRLTNDGYQYSGASFSPDGQWIAYGRSMGTDMIIDQELDNGGPRDLWVRPTTGAGAVNLTSDWDLDAGSPDWSPDSGHLYFTTGIGGETHLFRVAPTGGAVEQVTTGPRRIGGLDIDDSFERMAYTVGAFERPSEIYVADIDGGNERRLTDVHSEFLQGLDFSVHPAERVRYRSYDGTPVEGFLLFPHGYDPEAGPYPLIVMNHGGPHSASGYGFSFKNQLFAANGYFVFLPNFRGSTGYGDDFKWAIWGGWGTNDGEDVMAGVDHLVQRFPIDRARVGTTGHSYGGILTNWLITRYPDRFKAAVSGAGASNWTSNYAHSDVARTKETEFFGRPWEPRAREIMIRQSAYLNSGGVQAATLFVHGEVDYRVPLEGAIQLYTSLKKQRVPTKLIVYEGMAHGIRGSWNNIHRMMHELRWWDTYLKPQGDVLTENGN